MPSFRGPAELSGFAERAKKLIDQGDFDDARNVLNDGRLAARKLREQASFFEAEFLAKEAKIAHLQLQYREAATKYAEAAQLLVGANKQKQVQFLLAQADELQQQGDEFGDNSALRDAITGYRAVLQDWTRESVPLDWAITQNNLGVALSSLGERESGTGRLEEAVAAYRAALDIFEAAQASYYVEMARPNLARTEALLAERRKDKPQ